MSLKTARIDEYQPSSPLFSPTDSLFAKQWHLRNTGQTGGTAGIDINVSRAWDDYAGRNVSVGIYDDAVDYTHADLNDNYDATRHLVAGGVVQDPYPANTGSYAAGGDTHGTAVAGLVGGENNGAGSVGVAFDAELTGVAILRSSGASDLVQAMQEQDRFDVVNHSWGFTAAFGADFLSGDPELRGFAAGLVDAAANGRGGLGTVLVKAAGNSRAEGFETNYDNFGNSRFVTAVGAVDHKGQVTNYSTPGASLLVSAPSGGSGVGITTTDLSGARGDAAGDYRSNFGGTSAAAPMVSGVAALMLEANPNLGWRDVQEIFAYSARHVGSAIGAAPSGYEWSPWTFNRATNWNGGGLHFSNDYGFGLVDALTAVRLAESWSLVSNSANERNASVEMSIGAALPDNSTAGVIRNLNLPADIRLDHVELVVDVSHSARGDLKVALTSPSGTVSTLLDRPLNGSDTGDDLVFTLASNAFWGESSQGNWTVKITDEAAADLGTVRSVQLKVYGDTVIDDDVYVYTDEFARFGGQSGRKTISDVGGNDTVNAAAMTSNLVVDLRAGAVSSIAGQAVTLSNGAIIENVHGGDGGDQLTGNGEANKLWGGRGDDVLSGLGGNDVLDGGKGSDVALFSGNRGDYTISDAGGGLTRLADTRPTAPDAVDTLSNIEWLRFADGTFTIPEALKLAAGVTIGGTSGNDNISTSRTVAGQPKPTALSDILYGLGGNDSLDGGAGADRMFGGSGNDTYSVDNSDDLASEETDAGADDGGTDMVKASVSYAIGNFIENLTLTGSGAIDGTGNGLANKLVGNAAPNVLRGLGGNDLVDGGLGADALFGGAGNDTYTIDNAGDVASEETAAGVDDGGVDQVNSKVSFTLGAYLENLTLTGTDAIDGTGNALGNRLAGNAAANILSGGAGADTLTGNAGNDTLYGGSENDVLTGGIGADAMYGGTGDDRYTVDDAGDQVVEGLNAGTDSVTTSLSFALGDNVENLTLSGTAAIDGTGNGLANRLTGNTAANRLEGGGGLDVLSGGLGDDTLVGGAAVDMLIGGTGADIFVFVDASDSTATFKDRVVDFKSSELDRIDLSLIDANAATLADDSFAFLGNGVFTGHAGELRYTVSGTTATLLADLDGNGIADFAVTLNNVATFSSQDFIL